MNTSLTSRLLCAATAFGITACLLSAVVSLANVATESGTTTLMAMNQQTLTASVVIAMAD